jgi:predicted flap endonuclease-1-like 5' DNA nuclease
MHRIGEVEDIDAGTEAKLEGLGLRTTDDFLARAATPVGRAELASAVGSPEADVLKWANCADLMRVDGIGMQFADLLEEAGVDTIPELAQRNPQNLHTRVAELNAEKHLTGRAPTEAEVVEWVAQAKALPRILVYSNADAAVAAAPAAPVAATAPAPPPAPAEAPPLAPVAAPAAAAAGDGASQRAMAGEHGDTARTQVDDVAGAAATDVRGDDDAGDAGLAHAAGDAAADTATRAQDTAAATASRFGSTATSAASPGQGFLQRLLAKLRGGG